MIPWISLCLPACEQVDGFVEFLQTHPATVRALTAALWHHLHDYPVIHLRRHDTMLLINAECHYQHICPQVLSVYSPLAYEDFFREYPHCFIALERDTRLTLHDTHSGQHQADGVYISVARDPPWNALLSLPAWQEIIVALCTEKRGWFVNLAFAGRPKNVVGNDTLSYLSLVLPMNGLTLSEVWPLHCDIWGKVLPQQRFSEALFRDIGGILKWLDGMLGRDGLFH